jgi:glycine/D-amino acid oxidase-like deaminating enzyme
MALSSSFWLDNLSCHNFGGTQTLPSQTNVVVIGGGITGISTAYWLSKNGIEVTLLERRRICGGATGRNGGHLNPRQHSYFSLVLKKYGVETAIEILNYAHQNTNALKSFVTEHCIECDLSFSGFLALALSSQELTEVIESVSALTKHGFVGEYFDASKCAELTRSQDFLGGIFYPDAGQLWPAKLVTEMALVAARQGANLQPQTEVYTVENESNGLMVKSDRGQIKAKHVVYATNGWTRQLLPSMNNIIVPVRGQVLITEPVSLMWNFSFSTNFGYEYCLQRPDGRIVLGGMRWLKPEQEVGIDDDSTIDPSISNGLKEFLPQHFPELSNIQIDKEWTGILGFSQDNNPLIGPLPHRQGEYIAAGFSGHGMPMTFLAGKTVTEMIMGQSPEIFVKAFEPSRFFQN